MEQAATDNNIYLIRQRVCLFSWLGEARLIQAVDHRSSLHFAFFDYRLLVHFSLRVEAAARKHGQNTWRLVGFSRFLRLLA